MNPGDMLMLGHTTLRLEAGELYDLPEDADIGSAGGRMASEAAAAAERAGGAAAVPADTSASPALGAATPVGHSVAPFGLEAGDSSAVSKASVLRIASTQAMSIYQHPFTQLALQRGRERRAKEALAATASTGGTHAVAPPLLPTKRADAVAVIGDGVDPRMADPARRAGA